MGDIPWLSSTHSADSSEAELPPECLTPAWEAELPPLCITPTWEAMLPPLCLTPAWEAEVLPGCLTPAREVPGQTTPAPLAQGFTLVLWRDL